MKFLMVKKVHYGFFLVDFFNEKEKLLRNIPPHVF